jgi:hypothetical protein
VTPDVRDFFNRHIVDSVSLTREQACDSRRIFPHRSENHFSNFRLRTPIIVIPR